MESQKPKEVTLDKALEIAKANQPDYIVEHPLKKRRTRMIAGPTKPALTSAQKKAKKKRQKTAKASRKKTRKIASKKRKRSGKKRR